MKTRKYTIEGKEVSKSEFLKGIKTGKSGADVYVEPQHTVNAREEIIQTLQYIQDLAEENSHSVQDGYCQIAEWARNQIAKAERGLEMKSYIVKFVGFCGQTFKTGEYRSKKAIRRAQTRYDNEYGACLGVRIYDKATSQEISLAEVA